MNKRIAVLPGDGIGHEVIKEASKVLQTIQDLFDHDFQLEFGLVGASAIRATGDPFPQSTEALCRNSDAILFGAIGDPEYDNDPTAKVRPEQGLLRMRKTLGLFANIRPVKTYSELLTLSPLKESRIKGVDFVVFRELTGGIYFGTPSGISSDGDSAVDTSYYNTSEIKRISRLAFQSAQSRSRKLTLVDKANVLSTSRLWRKTVREMEKDYPDVNVDYMFVDNAAMQMILNPGHFDVVLTENMFGDILTDEASVLSGSIGLMPSASIGVENALYEPIHGSYPQAAGKNIANPMASILSVAMMLEMSFGLDREGKAVRDSVANAIAEGYVTEDLDPIENYKTTEVGTFVSQNIKSKVTAAEIPVTKDD